MPDLWHLIYISSATRAMGDADLADILEVSRRKNAERGLTGMLLYSDGSFIQVLEGARDTLHELFDRIARDARHCDITLLAEQAIRERAFGDWTMGFERADRAELARRAGVTDFLDSSKPLRDCFQGRGGVAQSLLVSFRNSNALRRGR